MLKVSKISATYGEGTVLRDVSLDIIKGRVTCLIGRNGAGKTTTAKAIMGLVATSGTGIKIDDKEVLNTPIYERARSGIGYVPQGRDIFPELTVKENLLLGLEAKNGKGVIPDYIFDVFPILKTFLNRKGGDLSGGQQQQLAIARVLVSEPKVLILDEPTEGIQPSIIKDIGRVIKSLKDDIAILIIEQYLEFVLDIADYCYVLENGRIEMQGETCILDKDRLQTIMAL
ncbi:urea ABC transporter ATP-binding subunit UrtE [Pseudolactococcus yaeyamensis]